MASQMTAILHQLELANASVEDDARMLMNLVAASDPGETSLSSSSSSSIDVTVAVAIALLLRVWSAGTLFENNVQSNEELGIWNAWKVNCPSRGLAAIEKLGWENWIPLLLPWLPRWHTVVAALLPCSTSPHLIRFLITSLARHAEHALLSMHPQDAIPAMKGLDTYLLGSSGSCSCSDARAACVGLEEVLDSWLGRYWKYAVDGDSEEVFQTACQLRTRLALCFSASSFNATEPEDAERKSIGREKGSTNKSDSPSGSKIEVTKAIWQQILYLNSPVYCKMKSGGFTGGTGPSPDNRFAIGLAAHIAVSALFLQDTTVNRLPLAHDTLKKSSIFSDADPTSPARVTLAALTLLEKAAIAIQNELGVTNSVVAEEEDKRRSSDPLLYTQSLDILPSLIWTISSLVPTLHQKQELLEVFPGKGASSTAAVTMFPAARSLLESDTRSTALMSFRQWALKETIALSNLVRTDEVFSKIKVLGEEGPGMDAAVHAVFPAALLCPSILLKVLVDDATGQRGKAMLFAGILQQLPTLRSVVNCSTDPRCMMNNSQPILLQLLRSRFEASATASLSEDQWSALQHCIVTLCSPSTMNPFPSAPTMPSGTSAPAVSPHLMLEYGVIPALNCAATTPVKSAEHLAMLLKLSRLLLELASTSSSAILSFRTVCSQLSSVSSKFLDFSSRRIDLNSLCLLLPREVIEEAYAVAQLCGTYTSSSLSNLSKLSQSGGRGDTGISSGGIIWERNDALCNSLALCIASNDREIGRIALSKVLDGIEPSQIKDALVVACAVMLACCAAEEASKLYTSLKDAVYYTLLRTGDSTISESIFFKKQSKGEEVDGNTLVSGSTLQGAVIELLCRAVHAVAFIPGLIPIAGEEIPIGSTPSQLRCRAVARLLLHLSLASQAAIDTAASSPASLKGALIARIFIEISRCAASISEYYDVSTLHVCLMQLVHGMKQELANTLELSLQVKNDIATAAKIVNDPALSATVAAVLDYTIL
ncbi:hypothetical protein NADE_000329 [Nannochloris sp. 'desiccata']|nr:hypothetical protein KSW81_004893 [Chlorella desiccata (nom. nud.)]KAH7618128.1 hypothetical protein NADE_000329 [Chlorella desiccata (nom. nud.)]